MSAAVWRNPVVLGIAALLLVILAAATFAIVPETEQAVVLRFEKTTGVYNAFRPSETFGNTGAGLIWRVPFIDRLVWVDKRVLDADAENQQVLSADQLRLQVDAFARFRIVDPLLMVKTSGSEQRVTDALVPLLASAIRGELGKHNFAVLLSPQRDRVMEAIRGRLQQTASQYGVEIVDVRIKHADLPTGSPLQSAYNRMITARRQQAATITAQAQKEAQIIRATADATAAQIYAQSFGKDPEFYDFYRAMQSYQRTFGPVAPGQPAKGSTSVILSPDNSYLKQFEGRGR